MIAPCVITIFLLAAPPVTDNRTTGSDRVTGQPFATRSEVIAANGIACTSHPLATQIALDILKRGGSAVDAAIAANAALGLMEPTGCGIGGDLFAIVWDNKSKKLHGLNGCGRSPYGLSLEEFRKRGLKSVPRVGPLSVSVPGCVDGWFELHRRFGKLPMKDLLAPTIAYARDGFPLTQTIAYYWAIGCERLKDQPNFLTTFAPLGGPPREGEIHRNPMLARTLSIIAEKGRDAFYKGELAETMDRFCRANGCFMRLRDLQDHTSTWVEPQSTNYRGYEVWELPPNGQGIAALQMLNILEPFNLRAMGHNSANYLHTLIETKKIVFEDRARFYADPDFTKIPVAALLSKSYAAQRRKLLNPHHATERIDAGNPALAAGDTIYLTVADKDHNMVSLIQSNYGGFGSGLCPDGLGFCLQNRGNLFDLNAPSPFKGEGWGEGSTIPPSPSKGEGGGEGSSTKPTHAPPPNLYAPHKRPFHTIIPAFVTKSGKPWLSFGVMGGDMQPQGHVQVLCNLIDFGMNLQEAGDAARFYHTGSSEPTGERMTDGGKLALESGIDAAVQAELKKRGHHLAPAPGAFGGYQAIMYDEKKGVYRGASESRKDGMAAGY